MNRREAVAALATGSLIRPAADKDEAECGAKLCHRTKGVEKVVIKFREGNERKELLRLRLCDQHRDMLRKKLRMTILEST